jgi:hypothetical protein
VKAILVSVRLRISSYRLTSANKLSGAVSGNGSNTSFRAFSGVHCPHISTTHMEFSPSYPAVPSREYLEPPPSCHPILSDGYESLIAMVCA